MVKPVIGFEENACIKLLLYNLGEVLNPFQKSAWTKFVFQTCFVIFRDN